MIEEFINKLIQYTQENKVDWYNYPIRLLKYGSPFFYDTFTFGLELPEEEGTHLCFSLAYFNNAPKSNASLGLILFKTYSFEFDNGLHKYIGDGYQEIPARQKQLEQLYEATLLNHKKFVKEDSENLFQTALQLFNNLTIK